MPARLTPSPMRAKPPPLVGTREGAPAKEAPTAMLMAAISSSACSTTRPMRSALATMARAMEVAGVMG